MDVRVVVQNINAKLDKQDAQLDRIEAMLTALFGPEADPESGPAETTETETAEAPAKPEPKAKAKK